MQELLNTKIKDWRIGENTELDHPGDDGEFSLNVEFNPVTGQLGIKIASPDQRPSMEMLIEVDKGQPAMHIGTLDDLKVHLRATDDSVLATSDQTGNYREGTATRFTYEETPVEFF